MVLALDFLSKTPDIPHLVSPQESFIPMWHSPLRFSAYSARSMERAHLTHRRFVQTTGSVSTSSHCRRLSAKTYQHTMRVKRGKYWREFNLITNFLQMLTIWIIKRMGSIHKLVFKQELDGSNFSYYTTLYWNWEVNDSITFFSGKDCYFEKPLFWRAITYQMEEGNICFLYCWLWE